MLLIDAYNVLWAADGVGAAGPPGLPQLAAWLARSRYAGRETVLVCDGRPPPWLARRAPADAAGLHRGMVGGSRVVFAGSGQDADSLIEELLEAHRGRGGVLVVSSDARVRRAAGRVKAQAVSSLDFLRELAADRARGRLPGKPAFASQVPLDAGSTAWWIRQFGLDGVEVGAGAVEASAADSIAGAGAGTGAVQRGLEPAGAGPGAVEPAAAGGVTPLPGGLRPHDPTAPAGVNPSVDRELWALGLSSDDLDMERWLRMPIDNPREAPPAAGGGAAPGSGLSKGPERGGRRKGGPGRGGL